MAKAERKVEERISRREFLKRAVIVSAATFLSACGISTSPSAEDGGTSPDLTPTPEPTKGPSLTPTETTIPTPTQTKTPEPTSTFTPEPTPTETPTPDWSVLNPEARFDVAPQSFKTEKGLVLEKSNVSSLKPDLIFYRDSEGWVRAAYDGKSDGKYEGFAFVLNIPEDVDKEQARELKKQALVAFFEIMLKKGATLRFRDAIAYDSFSNAIYNLGSTHLLPVSEIAGATREKNGGTSVSVFNRDGKLIGDLILKWWGVYLGDVDAYPERFVVIKIPNDNPWRREKKPSRLVDSDFFAGIIVGPIGGDEFETLLDEIVFSGGIIEK